MAGELDDSIGPLELRWEDGAATAFDVSSHWTLEIVDGHWRDPYVDASPARLRELESEVGIWVAHELAQSAALSRVIGQRLRSADPERNEVGELCGTRLRFETVTMRLYGSSGALVAAIEEP